MPRMPSSRSPNEAARDPAVVGAVRHLRPCRQRWRSTSTQCGSPSAPSPGGARRGGRRRDRCGRRAVVTSRRARNRAAPVRSRTGTATCAECPPRRPPPRCPRPRGHRAGGVRGGLSTKLASTPIGSARAGLSRPTRRLVSATHASSTWAPASPPCRRHRCPTRGRSCSPTPRCPEEKRFCSKCGEKVGRSRGAAGPARRGVLPEVRHSLLVHPQAASRRSRRRPVRGGRAASRTAVSAGSTSPRPQRLRPLRGAQGPAEHG